MEKLLLIEEVAEMTRLSENTLRFMKHQGRGPRCAKLGRRIVYRESDVQAWIDGRFEESARR